jgi:hypothetical protein
MFALGKALSGIEPSHHFLQAPSVSSLKVSPPMPANNQLNMVSDPGCHSVVSIDMTRLRKRDSSENTPAIGGPQHLLQRCPILQLIK